MVRRAVILTMLSVLVLAVGCALVDKEPGPVEKAASLIYPAGIDPGRTSRDPGYGYTQDNPVRIGQPGATGPVAAAHTYLSHLRDGDFRPMRFKQVQVIEAGGDRSGVGVWELRGGDGVTHRLYIDTHYPQTPPLDAAAPLGMYLYK